MDHVSCPALSPAPVALLSSWGVLGEAVSGRGGRYLGLAQHLLRDDAPQAGPDRVGTREGLSAPGAGRGLRLRTLRHPSGMKLKGLNKQEEHARCLGEASGKGQGEAIIKVLRASVPHAPSWFLRLLSSVPPPPGRPPDFPSLLERPSLPPPLPPLGAFSQSLVLPCLPLHPTERGGPGARAGRPDQANKPFLVIAARMEIRTQAKRGV